MPHLRAIVRGTEFTLEAEETSGVMWLREQWAVGESLVRLGAGNICAFRAREVWILAGAFTPGFARRGISGLRVQPHSYKVFVSELAWMAVIPSDAARVPLKLEWLRADGSIDHVLDITDLATWQSSNGPTSYVPRA